MHLILWLALFVGYTTAACTWPLGLANTEWWDGRRGLINFTSDTTMEGYTVATTYNVNPYNKWECHSTQKLSTNGYFSLKSTTSAVLFGTGTYYLYMCLNLTAITDVSFRYYLRNPKQTASLNYDRVSTEDVNSPLAYSSICLEDSSSNLPPLSEYGVWIKKGQESNAKIACPYSLLDTYAFNYMDGATGNEYNCTGKALDTCAVKTEMKFNYSGCNTSPTTVSFSVSNTVWCVDNVLYNNAYYVTTFNGNDNASMINNDTIFRYSCFALSTSGSDDIVSNSYCGNGGRYILTRSGASPCRTCPELTTPKHGIVTYKTDGAVTTALFTCSSQYSLAGMASRTCQADLTWSHQNPTCTCIAPSTLTNGSLSISPDGTTLSYTCNAGFVLVGSQTRTCTDNNSWSGAAPTCSPCVAIAAALGLVPNLTSTGLTTVAYFTCAEGYTLTGSVSSTCQTSGSWNTSATTCVACQTLTISGSMTQSMTTNGYVSVVTFSCKSGYTLNGDVSRTCGTGGTWNGTQATCDCTDPASPVNGTMTRNGSFAFFRCNVGYIMAGSASSECRANGTGWSSPTPTCNSCSSLGSITGGSYNLSSNGTTTTASYICNTGYTMSGATSLSCQTNTVWSSSPPTCVKCSNLTNIASGNITYTTDGHVTTANYACARGYYLKGNATLVCKTDGTWSSGAPECLCNNVTAPANGGIFSQDGKAVTYFCQLNYSISSSSLGYRTCSSDGSGWTGSDPTCVTCAPLLPVPNATYTLSAFNNLYTQAKFSCNVEWSMYRSGETIKCQEDGTWSPAYPSCVACTSLPALSSGNFTLSNVGGISTIATFTCASGYTMFGATTSTCIPNSNTTTYWNNPSGTCKCSNPNKPANGNVIADGATVTFTCNQGYSMNGSSSGICRTDGTGWSITTPTCIQCPALQNISSGSLTYTTNNVTTSATFSCNKGSTLNGTFTILCNAGAWQQTEPNCVTCPALPSVSITTGNLTMKSNGTTTTAEYHCPPNYKIKGQATLTCRSNGLWDAVASDCVCDTPTDVVGGEFVIAEDGLSVKYECEAGYSMVGALNIECDTAGNGWKKNFPNCTRCSNLVPPSKGSILLSSNGTHTAAQYLCGLGFTLSGGETPTCQPDGTWTTSTQPVCKKCTELPPVSISTGNVTLDTNGSVTVATYNCPTGYKVKGLSELTCGSDGSWDQPTASDCVCVDPSVPTGGNYTLSDDGLSVTFQCSAGYTMVGLQSVNCDKNGTGYLSTPPNCTNCEDLVSPTSGQVHVITDGTQTSAVYSCGVGATLVGEATPRCLGNGTWTNTQPTCVSCRDLKNISVPDGRVILTTDGKTTIATYSCPDKYVVNGETTLTCQPDGTWSAEESKCVSCVDLPPVSIATGNVTIESNGTYTIAKYYCPPNYVVKGKATLTCRPDGKWDSVQPSDCVCETPSDIFGGNYSLADNGLSVMFSCGTGYTMVGTATIECDTQGHGWTKTFPNCTKCGNLKDPINGNISLLTNGTMTTAQYLCGVGYTLSGGETPSCQQDGTWLTTAQPVCEKCSELPTLSITTGHITLSTNGSVTIATYNCPPGYKVKGSSVLTCGSGGTWDQPSSDCVCADPPLPVGGNYAVSEDGLSVTFACISGYTMVGQQTISCDTNGAGYLSSYPSCTKCNDLVSPTSGNVQIVTDGTQTSAVYSCEVGATLVGEATPRCLGNGTWTNTQPNCESCSTVPVADNRTQISTTNGTHTTINFTCGVGTTMLGSPVSTCLSATTWSSSNPQCVTCETLNYGNGAVTLSTEGLKTTAIVSCTTGYHLDSGGSEIMVECGTNGKWKSTPKCLCDDPPSVNNGVVEADGMVATYSCEVEFALLGSRNRACGSNGQGWTGSVPTCNKCNSLSTLVGGDTKFTTNKTATTATFTCKTGSTLSGNSTAICFGDGTWSSAVPTCVTCPALSSPANGQYSMSTNGTVTSVALVCNEGYETSEIASVKCMADGQWHWQIDQISTCELIDTGNSNVTSYLDALIAVSVVSVVIIAVLALILAWFVRRYMMSMRSGQSKYTFDNSYRNDAVKDFPALERATTSIAPINHQHHVLEKGVMLATSPAPSAFKKPTKQNLSETPRETEIETHRSGESIISFRRTKTSMTEKSISSISSVEISEPPQTRNPNRLVPIDDNKFLVGKKPNKSPRMNGRVPNLDLNGQHSPVRSNTPVNHYLRVSDTDKSSHCVSAVDN